MNRFLFSAVVGSALTFGIAGSATAAPWAASPSAPSSESLVQKAHGYHRSCAGDPDYLHRHTPSGRRIECGRSYYRDRDRGPNIILRFGDRDRRHDRRHRWRD